MNYCTGKIVDADFRSGMIAIAGRPNVGKSTLLNHLLGQKISITSKRANTTRHRILGVLSESNCQFVFVDTPGFTTRSKSLLERTIHKVATSGIVGVDLVLFVIDGFGWHPQDDAVWRQIQIENRNCVVIVSKIDRVTNKNRLLPVIEEISEKTGVTEIVPVSAHKDVNIDRLKWVITQHLSFGPPLFPSDFVTDQSEAFVASEILREQIFRSYGEELPYSCAIQIEKYQMEGMVLHFHVLLWMESENQKRMVIGLRGNKIKQVGSRVRQVLEARVNARVYVKIWVKVRSKWTEDRLSIEKFGYSE